MSDSICAECGTKLKRFTNQTVDVHGDAENNCELTGVVWLLDEDPDER